MHHHARPLFSPCAPQRTTLSAKDKTSSRNSTSAATVLAAGAAAAAAAAAAAKASAPQTDDVLHTDSAMAEALPQSRFFGGPVSLVGVGE